MTIKSNSPRDSRNPRDFNDPRNKPQERSERTERPERSEWASRRPERPEWSNRDRSERLRVLIGPPAANSAVPRVIALKAATAPARREAPGLSPSCANSTAILSK